GGAGLDLAGYPDPLRIERRRDPIAEQRALGIDLRGDDNRPRRPRPARPAEHGGDNHGAQYLAHHHVTLAQPSYSCRCPVLPRRRFPLTLLGKSRQEERMDTLTEEVRLPADVEAQPVVRA